MIAERLAQLDTCHPGSRGCGVGCGEGCGEGCARAYGGNAATVGTRARAADCRVRQRTSLAYRTLAR
jgi:hypothetical protein